MTEHDHAACIDEMTTLVGRVIAEHVAKLHTVDEETAARLIGEHTEMRRDVKLIRREMHGRPSPTLIDPDRHEGGVVEKVDSMEGKVDSMHEMIANGGIRVKREWGKGERAVAVALVTAATAVIVEFVRGLF